MEGRGLALLLMLIFALIFLLCAFIGDILVFVAFGRGHGHGDEDGHRHGHANGWLIASCVVTTCFIIVGVVRQIFGWCAFQGSGGDMIAIVVCSAISLLLSVLMCVWPPLHIVASIFTLLCDVAFLVIAILMMVGVL